MEREVKMEGRQGFSVGADMSVETLNYGGLPMVRESK